MELISTADIDAAAPRVAELAVRTPLLPCPWAEGELWLKPENLQPVGAFKVRGAANALALLPEEARRAGVVTHSSGNHGQALAYAARAHGVGCVVVCPENAPEVKVAAMRSFDAEVVPVPPAERARRAAEIAAERGMASVPPFDHRDVIAGQGTVGAEIVADLPDVDTVLVPVGGGGLAAGVATAVKARRPGAAVIGVEPELAADAAESLAKGRLVAWPTEQTQRTIADGVRVGPSALTFAHLRERLDGIVTVGEEEIAAAMGVLARAARVVAEPSGALTTAAYLAGRTPGGRTVAVVSGGNAAPDLLARAIAGEV
ncbi:threonine/serine dehydratase [Streptomonospora nanhaiensis]|uniref:Threonine dehydratase n=1 Tax=Streptomonospora nanhaiensis TaxID=1323731 RepID=A0A853BFB0_9ACTN|nr:threonine/serine dehydratase [Streptomonospora nanhaiensis]MBX9387523.1 threonine/serine dehydratase [Streptomonospora nanhaiensis]NYI94138.1 threonine dehydratase [Streptomonospora nanhaiensis]